MTAPKVLVLRVPGINCERETHHAFGLAGGAPEYVHVKKLLQQPELLDQFKIFMVPGCGLANTNEHHFLVSKTENTSYIFSLTS